MAIVGLHGEDIENNAMHASVSAQFLQQLVGEPYPKRIILMQLGQHGDEFFDIANHFIVSANKWSDTYTTR
jgi:hypothetical protein